MKAHAARSAPLGSVFWDGGASVFVNKGTSGRWKDTSTAEDRARYVADAREQLGRTAPTGGWRQVPTEPQALSSARILIAAKLSSTSRSPSRQTGRSRLSPPSSG